MAIISTDIKYLLSGGAANADPTVSYGGVISSTESSTTIFDDISSSEALAGDTEYRCIYIKNTHATLDYIAPVVWIQSPSVETTVTIAVGNAAINGTETAVANEGTAPSPALTFTAPSNLATGLSLGTLAPGAYKSIWIKRVVPAASAAAADGFTLRVQGDSNP